MEQITFECEVVTPMFLGGADQHAELRAPSIRGAMRWWFRAMMGGVVGGTLSQVNNFEEKVFGTTENVSSIAVLTKELDIKKKNKKDPAPNHKGITYLGYSLFSYNKDAGKMEYAREAFEVGSRFEIKIVPVRDKKDLAIAKASLMLLLNYGALGSRSRKGFGSLQLLKIDGKVVDSIDLKQIEKEFLLYSNCSNKIFSLPGQSSFPSFAKGKFLKLKKTQKNGWKNWEEAMNDIGEFYRRYRLDSVIDRTPDYLKVIGDFLDKKFDLGTAPYQTNPDLENDIFGLPIQWRSRSRSPQGKSVSAILTAEQTVNGKLDKIERRASPITIHFGKENGEIVCSVMLLESQFLPSIANQKLDYVPSKWPIGIPKPSQISIPLADYSKLYSFMADLAKEFHVKEQLP